MKLKGQVRVLRWRLLDLEDECLEHMNATMALKTENTELRDRLDSHFSLLETQSAELAGQHEAFTGLTKRLNALVARLDRVIPKYEENADLHAVKHINPTQWVTRLR